MSERLSITPLGPYIGAQISGADLTRPLSDNQFEQLYHAVLRHQVVFLRDQTITPQQQRALAQRFWRTAYSPCLPSCRRG
ncbi:alpha-ketoglutarate-dependent taurine dioxygenase [Escherichia coli]|uniref:Alpha-ketoglutarate-dependent taurine dioxygenase n=1 Tax=Escherichia coli TaxID=562 RepID=A0A376KZE7_ECOLX|nr:alpha-ketoglutarate-dependent taurine dioxygenase [Escherichia coli]